MYTNEIKFITFIGRINCSKSYRNLYIFHIKKDKKMKRVLSYLFIFFILASFTTNAQMKSGKFNFHSGTDGYSLHEGKGDRIFRYDVKFDKPFETVPQIITSVNLVDADKENNTRFNLEAISISRDGFVIKIWVWAETKIYGIGGSWFAQAEKLKSDNIKVQEGVTIQLRNVTFDLNKAELKPESHDELNTVVQFMKNNPSVKIEIAGHTDNTGKAEHNLELSQKRADAVKNYIYSNGVNIDRLIAKGYGETKPVADNDIESGREMNRRVEFTIISK